LGVAFLCNPPWIESWLTPFFQVLLILEAPFFLYLPKNFHAYVYFMQFYEELVKKLGKSHTVELFEIAKDLTFQHRNKAKPTEMRRVHFLICYPKEWKWKLNTQLFRRIVPVTCLLP
jgi:hypothetical protein